MLSQTLQQRRELKEEEEQQTSTEQRLRPRQDRTVGKRERHNKVFTSKGLMRDRRVRLSAHTAIRFYDIQDRLGFDQPSLAIDWLLDMAKSAIDTLYHHHPQQQQRSIIVEADHDRIESYEDPYVFDSLLPASLLSILASDDNPPIRVRDHDNSNFTEGYFSSGGFVGI